MLDNLVNSLRRGVERARTRGEEVTQAARLRLEIFQLNRELDGLYGRLGRAYHANADLDVLSGVRGEISHVDDEIAAREQAIADLGQASAEDAGGEPEPAAADPSSPTPPTSAARPLPAPEPMIVRPEEPALIEAVRAGAVSDGAPAPKLPSASRIFQAKRQEERMTDPTLYPDQPADERDTERFETDATGLNAAQERNPLIARSDERDAGKDDPNEDYQQRVDQGQRLSGGSETDASLHGSDAPIPKLGTLAGNPDDIARAPVTPNTSPERQHEENIARERDLETRIAGEDPDPLG